MKLPPLFTHHLRNLAEGSDWGMGVHRKHLLKHLHRWRRNPKTTLPLPGYLDPPSNAPGLNHPHGWSLSNFERIAKAQRQLLNG